MATLKDVKKYWEEHPLHGFELKHLGSREFFEDLDRIKREDIERFSQAFWEFGGFRGKKILEVGCGPGWFTVQYALGGAEVHAVDLSSRAVELTREHLAFRGLTADLREGNAEELDFEDNTFDYVLSAGVLHHTPDTAKAVRECYRVLKSGGCARIALYHKGLLHQRFLFGLTRTIMSWIRMKHPGADPARAARDVDDFIRQYDGTDNPVGIGKTTREWTVLLGEAGFRVESHELHYFPKRFIRFHRRIPVFMHYRFDRFFGTMIYFNVRKPLLASGGPHSGKGKGE